MDAGDSSSRHKCVVSLEIVRARRLPRNCTVGPLKSVYCTVGSDDKQVQSSVTSIRQERDGSSRLLVAIWNQTFRFSSLENERIWSKRFRVKLFGSGCSSVEPALQLTTQLGEVCMHFEGADPFENMDGNFHLSRQLCANGVCTIHEMEKWFPVSQETEQSKIEVLIKISLRFFSRDVSYVPSPEFMRSASFPPSQRCGLDVRLMASELLRACPATLQISRPLVMSLMEHAVLQTWQRGDVAEPQPRHARESSLHIVLYGRLALFSGGADLPHPRLGQPRGWRGPGEALGEGALLAHGGVAVSAVCDTAEAQTLRVDRRVCEELMEPIRRLEAHFSADVQATAASPASPCRPRPRPRTG